MKRKKFTEEQIIAILKESEAGAKNQDLCRKHGITEQTFYRWRSKYVIENPRQHTCGFHLNMARLGFPMNANDNTVTLHSQVSCSRIGDRRWRIVMFGSIVLGGGRGTTIAFE